MSNSRARFQRSEDKKPSNSSKGEGLILETPYRPGFVEDKDLESVKMAVDKELSDISNAFYQTTERTAESIKRIDKLELNMGDNLQGLIQKEEEIRKEQDGILAQKIETVRAESSSGIAEVKQTTSALSDGLGKVEAKWGVQTNVNDKIAGIQLNNDGKSSSFSVVSDKFTISDGTNDSSPPFEVVGEDTRIKSAYVERIQSDNYSSSAGWAINKDGNAVFNQVSVRGKIEGDSGYFKGDITGANGTFSGNLSGANITGATGTFSGTVNANGGVFNNVTIKENCSILGTITAAQVRDDIIAIQSLGENGTWDFGVKNFPRTVSIHLSACSGYRGDTTTITGYVNGGSIGGISVRAVAGDTSWVPLSKFGSVSYKIPANSSCVVKVTSSYGAGGSTSAIAIVNKTD